MGSPALLVSDVDNTLLGNDAALGEFHRWLASFRDSLRLAYSSGRFPASVAESVRTTDLPDPDAIIGGVGSEIFFPATGELLDNWPTPTEWDTTAIRQTLLAHKELTLQPEHLLSEYKLSFYGHDLSASFIDGLRHELQALGHAIDIVYSSRRDLDVLPAGVNKGSAAARLAEHFQIDPRRVIVAGDSGNDLAMFAQGFRGIVVGNAQPELKAVAGGRVYQARGCYAAGVLEGLQFWLETSDFAARSASEVQSR